MHEPNKTAALVLDELDVVVLLKGDAMQLIGDGGKDVAAVITHLARRTLSAERSLELEQTTTENFRDALALATER